MRYVIVTLIMGEAADFQQKLLYDIAEKFGVNEAIKGKLPAHITLKYSFETVNINPIENLIKNFCKQNKKCSFKLNGINHFDHSVVFIDVEPSKEMSSLYKDLIAKMREIKDLTFNKFDGSVHFHVALAYQDIEDKFNDIFEYAKKKAKNYELQMGMDSISILKLVDDVWKIHKQFKLNGKE